MDLQFMAFGDTRAPWEACAEVSSQVHVKYVPKAYNRVVSIISEMYEDMWTGAKGFYKMEPVVADGGELIIYAPHIKEVSVMHPGIEEIGYHNRQYFVGQWERFKDHPWGELAHSTHLRGLGDYVPRQVVGRISSCSKVGTVVLARPRWTSRGRFQAIAS